MPRGSSTPDPLHPPPTPPPPPPPPTPPPGPPPPPLILQERRSRTKLFAFLVILEIELVLPIVSVHDGNVRADAQVFLAELQDIRERSALGVLRIRNRASRLIANLLSSPSLTSTKKTDTRSSFPSPDVSKIFVLCRSTVICVVAVGRLA